MADKIRGKKQSATATSKPKFVPCEKELFGGFDARGNEPGRNALGSACVGGMRTFWSMQRDQNGNELGYERFASRCKCLREWSESNRPPEEPAAAPAPRRASPAQATFSDGKSRAAQ